jgi:hypothetical protein
VKSNKVLVVSLPLSSCYRLPKWVPLDDATQMRVSLYYFLFSYYLSDVPPFPVPQELQEFGYSLDLRETFKFVDDKFSFDVSALFLFILFFICMSFSKILFLGKF